MIPFLPIQAVTDRHADEIAAAVDSVVRSGWYLRGEATHAFEQAYAAFVGTRHCVGCANGLDALFLILKGYIELGRLVHGDEVIVPANTFIASVLAVTRCGLRPVLVEPRADDALLDDSLVETAITPRTRAVMAVHLYGRCAITPRLVDICQRHHLLLIEDNAQAHGAYRPGTRQRTGSLGDAAGHSFYPGKNLGALGDAGAVTTNDDALADIVRRLGNYGMQPRYHCAIEGVNSRIDEVQAAVLSVKLRYLDEDNARRRAIARAYCAGLRSDLVRTISGPNGVCNNLRPDDVSTLPCPDDDSCVWHIFPVFTPHRDALQRHLTECGIETLIHYPVPPHRQQCFSQWPTQSLPVTDALSATELSLPISPVISDSEMEEVIHAVNSFKP